MNQSFSKSEHLCLERPIEELVTKGKSLNEPGIKLRWILTVQPDSPPVQIAISVSKKKFKKAVDRNYIKRLCREVYRKNKSPLFTELEQKKRQLNLLLIYTDSDLPKFKELEQKIIVILQRLIKAINEDSH